MAAIASDSGSADGPGSALAEAFAAAPLEGDAPGPLTGTPGVPQARVPAVTAIATIATSPANRRGRG